MRNVERGRARAIPEGINVTEDLFSFPIDTGGVGNLISKFLNESLIIHVSLTVIIIIIADGMECAGSGPEWKGIELERRYLNNKHADLSC